MKTDADASRKQNRANRGRASENKTAFVMALSTTVDGRPHHALQTSLMGFTEAARAIWMAQHHFPECEGIATALPTNNPDSSAELRRLPPRMPRRAIGVDSGRKQRQSSQFGAGVGFHNLVTRSRLLYIAHSKLRSPRSCGCVVTAPFAIRYQRLPERRHRHDCRFGPARQGDGALL